MRLFGRREPAIPTQVASALTLGHGDRVLAWARDATTGAYVVASLHALHQVPGRAADGAAPSAVAASGAAAWSRPWRDVAAGAWAPSARTLTITWADGGRPAMWSLEDDRVRLPSVVQERVKASVLVAVPVQLGERDLGRVALRKDLASGELVEQVSLRRGVSGTDPEVAEYVAVLLGDLREQAGI